MRIFIPIDFDRTTAQNQQIPLDNPFLEATYDFLKDKFSSIEKFPYFDAENQCSRGILQYGLSYPLSKIFRTTTDATIFWASNPLPKSAASFYIEVTLCSGSFSVGFGSPNGNKELFWFSSNGVFNRRNNVITLPKPKLGETIGTFLSIYRTKS